MTPRRLTILFLTAALIVPCAVFAQGPPDGPRGGQGNAIRELLPPPGYLQLTEAQQETVRAMAEELRAAVEPIREAERAAREALRAALESDTPDATEIGNLTLEVRGLAGQLRAEMEAFGDAFRGILDADQQVKWDNFRELRRLSQRGGDGGPRGKAMRRLHR